MHGDEGGVVLTLIQDLHNLVSQLESGRVPLGSAAAAGHRRSGTFCTLCSCSACPGWGPAAPANVRHCRTLEAGGVAHGAAHSLVLPSAVLINFVLLPLLLLPPPLQGAAVQCQGRGAVCTDRAGGGAHMSTRGCRPAADAAGLMSRSYWLACPQHFGPESCKESSGLTVYLHVLALQTFLKNAVSELQGGTDSVDAIFEQLCFKVHALQG